MDACVYACVIYTNLLYTPVPHDDYFRFDLLDIYRYILWFIAGV